MLDFLFPNLHRKLDKIMTTQAELAAKLKALREQNDKATAEQNAALQKLRDELANMGNLSPEAEAALEELSASIQRDDDQNPDAPTGGDTGGEDTGAAQA